MTPEEVARINKLFLELHEMFVSRPWDADNIKVHLDEALREAEARGRLNVLVQIYNRDYTMGRPCSPQVAVADLCDEKLDRSGALLGDVRAEAERQRSAQAQRVRSAS